MTTPFAALLHSVRPYPLLWALLIIEAAAVAAIQAPWTSGDSQTYLELARNLSGAGFVTDGAPNGLRTPAYPWFLNVLLFRIGLPLAGVIIVQMAFYLASIWLIAYRAISQEEQRRYFLVFALVYPFPFFYSAMVLTEALAIFCVASIVALLGGPNRPWRYVAAGSLVGLGALLRTDLLPVIVAVMSVAAYRRSWSGALLAVVAAFLVLLPYMAWNQQTFGQFTPVPPESRTGQSLYRATWEDRLRGEDFDFIDGEPGTPPTQAAIESGLAEDSRRIEQSSPNDHSAGYKQAAMERMKAAPVATIWHALKATWRLFSTAKYSENPLLNAGFHLISNLFWLLGVIGAAIALRHRKELVPATVLLAFLIPHLPLHTEARYTASVRLILLFYAALAVARIVAAHQRRRSTA